MHSRHHAQDVVMEIAVNGTLQCDDVLRSAQFQALDLEHATD